MTTRGQRNIGQVEGFTGRKADGKSMGTTADRPIERILVRLDMVRQTSRGFMARCPAHDDRHPSLSVAEGEDGKVLMRCWAGCDVPEILVAIGLTWADMFPATNTPRTYAPQRDVSEAELKRWLEASYKAEVEGVYRSLTQLRRVAWKLNLSFWRDELSAMDKVLDGIMSRDHATQAEALTLASRWL